MKRAIVLLIVALIAVCPFSGCMTTFASSNVKLGYGEIRGAEKGDLDIVNKYVYIIHPNLVTFGDGRAWESLDAIVKPALADMGANAVKNLNLSIGHTTMDFILTCLTGGFLGFGHYGIQGTAVKQ